MSNPGIEHPMGPAGVALNGIARFNPLAAPGDDTLVSVSVDNGPPTEALLRFGYGTATSLCTDQWGGGAYGRWCQHFF